jgi:hypothetical protein
MKKNSGILLSPCWLVFDLEDFDFCDFEITRTREKSTALHSGVVGVNKAKVLSRAVGISVTVIRNSNVRSITIAKAWTPSIIATDCLVLPLKLQWKSPRGDVVGILQGKKETLPTLIRLEQVCLALLVPLQLRDSHSTGGNPPKIFTDVSKFTVSVFAWLSHPPNSCSDDLSRFDAMAEAIE